MSSQRWRDGFRGIPWEAVRTLRLPGRATVIVAALGVALLLTSLGGAVVYAYTGDIPRGTTVLGIDIGGLDRAEAQQVLTAGLAQRSDELAAPVTVRIGDETTTVSPEAVGLAVDVPATVDRAARGSRWSALFGGRDVRPVVTVDQERLYEALRETAERVGHAMTMPEIRFEGLTPVPTYPEPGLGVDPAVAAAALTKSWPPPPPPGDGWVEPPVVTVPLVDLVPVTTAEDVDRLLAELARPAVAAPVTAVTTDGDRLTIPPEVIADSLDLTADSRGEIVPAVDPEDLREGLADQLADVETQPVDAHFRTDGPSPRLVNDRPGRLVDVARLADALLAVLPQPPGERQVEAVMVDQPAEVTRAELEELGIVEEVSTFTTYFDGGPGVPRNHNIIRVAQMVDGAIVRPGEIFSLNGYTGPRGYEQGFVDAPVILEGRLQPGVGGGISQFTTTLFNAAYYAGLEDVEHWPHSYYYSRYPPVIEATIYYPTLDMKFRNDTPYGILIDTSYTDGSVTVTLWGTKVWDKITTEWGPRRDVVQPPTRYIEPGPTCIATNGIEGFTQDAWRVFYKDGIEVKRERFTWRYDAQPNFICGEKPRD